MASRSALLLLLAAAAVSSAAAGDVTLAPQGSTNNMDSGSLSPILNPSYTGIGIEPSNLLSFTGTNSVNRLTYNLLSNLGTYTGAPPHIRVGGNSGDNALYSPSFQDYYFQPNPSSSGPGLTSNTVTDYWRFGPNYFRALDRMPKGTPVTYGLNLAYQGADAMSQIIRQAAAAFDNLNNVNLVGLEIGNEPDLFITNAYRTSSYTAADYGGEWSERAQALYEQVLQPRNISTAFFEAAATATTATNTGHAYRIENLVQTGLATGNGIYVAGWNQHDYYYYISVSSFPLTTERLLSLDTTEGQFTEWARQAQQALVTGKPYYLREMGSVGPEGIKGISDTFANAIWTFNFFLYAATVQVSAVQMHVTDNSYGSPWQPVTSTVTGMGPHVRPAYYAYAAFTQIIGPSCNTRVSALDVQGASGDYRNNLRSYAYYAGNALQGIAMINSKPYYQYGGQTPGTTNFNVNFPGQGGKTIYLSTMLAGGADSTDNTTWNGISYERSGNGQATTVDSSTQTLTLDSNGGATIVVRDSQVVVANLGSKLGSNTTPNAANCLRLANNSPEVGDPTKTGPGGGGRAAPTFSATTGFMGNGEFPKKTIIAIAAGGGAGVLLGLGLCIWLCCCCAKKRRKERELKAAYGSAAVRRLSTRPKVESSKYGEVPSDYDMNNMGHSPPRFPTRFEDSPRSSRSLLPGKALDSEAHYDAASYDGTPSYGNTGYNTPVRGAPETGYHSNVVPASYVAAGVGAAAAPRVGQVYQQPAHAHPAQSYNGHGQGAVTYSQDNVNRQPSSRGHAPASDYGSASAYAAHQQATQAAYGQHQAQHNAATHQQYQQHDGYGQRQERTHSQSTAQQQQQYRSQRQAQSPQQQGGRSQSQTRGPSNVRGPSYRQPPPPGAPGGY